MVDTESPFSNTVFNKTSPQKKSSEQICAMKIESSNRENEVGKLKSRKVVICMELHTIR